MSSFDEEVPVSATTDRGATVGFGVFVGCRRRRFRRQSKRINNSRKNKSADPSAIAIMAAFESFLDFLTGAEGLIESGDGAGAGKNGLHGANGPPQRSRFPAKEDEGNFARVSGIEPLSLLFETLKSTKSAGLMLGRLPENPLFSNKRPVKRVKLLTANGILPVKLFEERSRRVNRTIPVTLAGKSPENRLFWR